jgi:hypothetical protein
MKDFFNQPTWLTLKIWNHYQFNQSKLLQQQSISVAKLTSCIVGIANSFGGDKNKTVELDNFTLYKFATFEHNEISDEAIAIFNQCKDKNLLVDYVLKTFANDKHLVEAIKEKK